MLSTEKSAVEMVFTMKRSWCVEQLKMCLRAQHLHLTMWVVNENDDWRTTPQCPNIATNEASMRTTWMVIITMHAFPWLFSFGCRQTSVIYCQATEDAPFTAFPQSVCWWIQWIIYGFLQRFFFAARTIFSFVSELAGACARECAVFGANTNWKLLEVFQ